MLLIILCLPCCTGKVGVSGDCCCFADDKDDADEGADEKVDGLVELEGTGGFDEVGGMGGGADLGIVGVVVLLLLLLA